jgi:hypothetical protein
MASGQRNSTPAPPPVLVWRPRFETLSTAGFRILSSSERLAPSRDRCRHCAERTVARSLLAATYISDAIYCGFCGWFRVDHDFETRRIRDRHQTESILRALSVDSAELCLDELKRAIVARPDLIDSVHHRRFEEIIADAFRNVGYSVELTRPTKDGGRDLVVLRHDDDHEAIVEIKRYRGKVGVDLVRQLRGVQLRDGVAHAILVAARGFTADAHAEAGHPRPAELGFTMSLVDALDLLRSLDLLHEPAMSVAAVDRDRSAYRDWIDERFRSDATDGLASDGPRP